MPLVTLYNALTGASCLVDAGKGLRAKAWIDELPRWLKECVEPTALAGLGLGRLANFPSVVDGSKMQVRPTGELLQTPNFSGVEIFRCMAQTCDQVWVDAGGAQNVFGVAALTQGDPAQDNYGVAANVSGVACVPVNSTGYPAFLLSNTENYNTAGAGANILTIIVNGATYTITVTAGAAVTAEQMIADIQAGLATQNIPVHAVGIASGGDAIDQIRLLTTNTGRSATLQVPNAGAGAVVFAAAAGGLARGYGGPLNAMQGATATLGAQIPGLKFQRRILPGSVVVTGQIAGPVAFTLTDNRAGVLSNLAGTSVGTITYATGAITVTLAAAVAATVPIVARYKSLEPVSLFQEVRLPETGAEFAIRLLP